ncbi:MAG: CNNM domain-containing protein [Desulfovibrio sp.]|jgi:CBS domain containing-hemolysin-like protein|nr:CNNM domain-containing protein [Desulfovibrio sp.]
MLTLTISIAIAVIISFFCSLTEAALYAVPWSSIEKMRRAGQAAGERLYRLRIAIDKPIAAILTLNTTANTAGATVAGAAFLGAFGAEYMPVFAVVFTLIVLALGEIVPKTLGVANAAPVAAFMSRALVVTIKAVSPLLWLTGMLTRLVSAPAGGPNISEDDIRAAASLSRQAGQIKPYEERFIRNVLALDQKRVRDIMTPRTVVFSLPEEMTVEKAYANPAIWHVSRIPVYGDDNEDLVGVVERRALDRCFKENRLNTPLSEIMRPLYFVLETQTLDVLLHELLKSRGHLFAVLDEYAGLAGVVSLEDVLEEILGSEIMDESDRVADLRALARRSRKALTRMKTYNKPDAALKSY